MDNVLKYKNYSARIEYSAEDHVLYGKIEGIADLVNFESETVEGVEDAFHEAVDDYLTFCAEIGKTPDREYKGTFNVRVSPQLHAQLDRAAHDQGISMNQFIEKALSEYLIQLERSDSADSYRGYEYSESPVWQQTQRVLWNSSTASVLNKLNSELSRPHKGLPN